MKNVPKLRFKGFSGEWNSLTLGKVFTFKNGINALKEQYGHGIKFINVLDIINNNFITYENIIGSVNVKESEIQKNDVKYGDILFQRSSETREEVGQSNVYLGEKPVVFGGFVIRGRGIVKYNPIFFHYLLKTSSIRDQITQRSGGSTRYNIGQESLSVVPIVTPAQQEQTKIADFLTAIDDRISQLSQKCDGLAQYKKGVMQKIFSQELRFKDDKGRAFPAWEWKNGNFIFENISDRNHKSDLPVLAITQEFGAIPRDMIDFKISVMDSSIENYKVVRVGEFIISLRSFQGGIEYANHEGICSPAYVVLRPIIEINTGFFKNYLKTENYIRSLQKNLEGIRDGKMISFKYFSEVKLPYPCIAEQAKIAGFLSAVDERISQAQAQLAALKQYKQGLLQQMFV